MRPGNKTKSKRKKAGSPKGGGGVDFGRELEKVQNDIRAANLAEDELLEKDQLTPGEERKLASLRGQIEMLEFTEANCFRALQGEPLVPPQVSKSFRDADIEHIAKATGVDLRSSIGDLEYQDWLDLPDGNFSEDRLDRLVTEWIDVSKITTFFHESSHRLLIDRVLEAVVELFEGHLVITCEQSVEVSQHEDGTKTAYVLRGDVDYTVVYDESRKLAAGKSSELAPQRKAMNFVAVEAKRDNLEITDKARTQLIAETCALRKIRTGAGRTGLIFGVLSNAKEWQFIMIDEEDKLHISDMIIVKLGTPDRAALRQVCRVIYGMLNAGIECEHSFRPQPARN